jgi:SAM-dependent methyltransferase
MSNQPQERENQGRAESSTDAQDGALENRYYAYLRAQGYSTSDALLDVLRVYLPHFEGLTQVADLGCGHGEFLAMLRDAGHTATGVDVDPAMVEACRAQGFDVALGDAATWLLERPGQFDAVFSSNVIEHLPADTVRVWVAAAYAALRPGGMLLLATPNPASAIVQFHEFWRDPTHVRMYAAQLVEFMLVDAGFTAVQSVENDAARWDGIDQMLRDLDAPLPEFAIPPTSGELPPLPTLPADSSLRARWAFGLSSWVYRKFTEPYVLPLRKDLARMHATVDAQAQALVALKARQGQVVTRMQALAQADRFLHPSREIAIFGYKPAAGNVHTVDEGDAQPSDSNV